MDDLYNMPGHLIRRMQQLSVAVFSERIRLLDLDLTSPQFAALSILSDSPDIDQATLARRIAHDCATIGGIVERLEAKGLLTRHRNPKDRRAKVMRLTPEGADLIRTLVPEVQDIQDDTLPGLTQAERAEFVRLAKKVTGAGRETQPAGDTIAPALHANT